MKGEIQSTRLEYLSTNTTNWTCSITAPNLGTMDLPRVNYGTLLKINEFAKLEILDVGSLGSFEFLDINLPLLHTLRLHVSVDNLSLDCPNLTTFFCREHKKISIKRLFTVLKFLTLFSNKIQTLDLIGKSVLRSTVQLECSNLLNVNYDKCSVLIIIFSSL